MQTFQLLYSLGLLVPNETFRRHSEALFAFLFACKHDRFSIITSLFLGALLKNAIGSFFLFSSSLNSNFVHHVHQRFSQSVGMTSEVETRGVQTCFC